MVKLQRFGPPAFRAIYSVYAVQPRTTVFWTSKLPVNMWRINLYSHTLETRNISSANRSESLVPKSRGLSLHQLILSRLQRRVRCTRYIFLHRVRRWLGRAAPVLGGVFCGFRGVLSISRSICNTVTLVCLGGRSERSPGVAGYLNSAMERLAIDRRTPKI